MSPSSKVVIACFLQMQTSAYEIPQIIIEYVEISLNRYSVRLSWLDDFILSKVRRHQPTSTFLGIKTKFIMYFCL